MRGGDNITQLSPTSGAEQDNGHVKIAEIKNNYITIDTVEFHCIMSIAPDQYKCDQINRPSLIPSELTSWLYQWKVIWVDSKMNQPC